MNHQLDSLFYSKEVIMKIKPKKTEGKADDIELDEQGYKDLPTVGVSSYKL